MTTRGRGRPRIPTEVRLETYKDIVPSTLATPCHLWTGALTTDGYGVISLRDPGVPRRNKRVHILAYELFVGPVPEGMTLDHLCHKRDECNLGKLCPHRRCFNPLHLEPKTIGDN